MGFIVRPMLFIYINLPFFCISYFIHSCFCLQVILDASGGPGDGSFSLTNMVTFDCNNYGYGNRTGYAPDVDIPILCELVDPTDASQGVQWNSTDLPTCIGRNYYDIFMIFFGTSYILIFLQQGQRVCLKNIKRGTGVSEQYAFPFPVIFLEILI